MTARIVALKDSHAVNLAVVVGLTVYLLADAAMKLATVFGG